MNRNWLLFKEGKMYKQLTISICFRLINIQWDWLENVLVNSTKFAIFRDTSYVAPVDLIYGSHFGSRGLKLFTYTDMLV